MKEDKRPQRHGWAPGGYWRKCRTCNDDYMGDKRSWICADCAYNLPLPVPPDISLPPSLQSQLTTALDQLEKAKKALREIQLKLDPTYYGVGMATATKELCFRLAASTLKELEK
jgi:hypothetical protein